jgi:hypothetical protein
MLVLEDIGSTVVWRFNLRSISKDEFDVVMLEPNRVTHYTRSWSLFALLLLVYRPR